MSRPLAPPAPQGRVLVVDDEEVIASTLQEFLAGEGYEVAVAGDAPSALARSRRSSPTWRSATSSSPGSTASNCSNACSRSGPS